MKYSKILGVGSYLPPQIWTNKDLATLMLADDPRAQEGWIEQRTGIKERRLSDVYSSDLGLEAANRAIEAANVKKEDIDMIIFSTADPDHDTPGSCFFFQAKFGTPNIPTFDIRQNCNGFIYSLSIADQFIRTGFCKTILIVCGEGHFKPLRRRTDNEGVNEIFGDGAGAAVIGVTEDVDGPRILSTHLHADGNYAKDLWTESGTKYAQMNGKVVFTHACKRMPEVIREAVSANNYQVSDVDFFVFHQANLRINEKVGERLDISSDKVFNTIQKYGNTKSATIPIGIDEALKADKIKPGMLIALGAFGAGFAWSGALIRW
jgi:3-oxoacyl-[acyl-carrier-protein] synthase-3